jgi:hypothetical protein
LSCLHREILQEKSRQRSFHYQPRLQMKVNVNFSPRLLYPLKRNTATQLLEAIIGPRAGLDVVNKKKIHCPASHRTQGVQPLL